MRHGQSIWGWCAVLVLVFVPMIAFRGVVQHDFVDWDDNSNVYENPWLRPLHAANMARFWRAPYERLYIPVTYGAWALQAALAGDGQGRSRLSDLDPRVFHRMSLAVHIVNGLLVFALLLRLGGARCPARNADRSEVSLSRSAGALVGALAFGLHPVQVEAVAWVTGQKDLLCGLFSFLAILAFLNALRRRGAGTTVGWLLGASACYAAALLAKPAAVGVPLMALGAGCCWSAAQGASRPLGRGPFGVLAVWVLLALGVTLFTRSAQVAGTHEFVPPLRLRPLVAGDALGFYARKLIWPARLGLDYGRSPLILAEREAVLWVTGGIPLLIVAIALVALGWAPDRRRSWRRWPGWVWGAVVFLAGVLPVLGLVPFKYQNMSTVADRYLYLAMPGAAVVLSDVVQRFSRSARGRVYVGLSLVLVLPGWAIRSAMQVRCWRDTETLFACGVKVNPASWTLRNNLGVLLGRSGRTEQAIEQFSQVLVRYPRNGDAHANIGNALVDLGRIEQALSHYRAVLALNPRDAETLYNIGVALGKTGRLDEAVAHYSRALALDRNYASAHFNLAGIYQQRGRRDEARRHFSEVLRIAPGDADAARALRALGE